MAETKIEIHNPWIIVYEPVPKEGMVCRLHGPPDADYGQFGIVIADVIRHVAKKFDVDEADVLEWVHKEMDEPTSEIKRHLQS